MPTCAVCSTLVGTVALEERVGADAVVVRAESDDAWENVASRPSDARVLDDRPRTRTERLDRADLEARAASSTRYSATPADERGPAGQVLEHPDRAALADADEHPGERGPLGALGDQHDRPVDDGPSGHLEHQRARGQRKVERGEGVIRADQRPEVLAVGLGRDGEPDRRERHPHVGDPAGAHCDDRRGAPAANRGLDASGRRHGQLQVVDRQLVERRVAPDLVGRVREPRGPERLERRLALLEPPPRLVDGWARRRGGGSRFVGAAAVRRPLSVPVTSRRPAPPSVPTQPADPASHRARCQPVVGSAQRRTRWRTNDRALRCCPSRSTTAWRRCCSTAPRSATRSGRRSGATSHDSWRTSMPTRRCAASCWPQRDRTSPSVSTSPHSVRASATAPAVPGGLPRTGRSSRASCACRTR